LDIPAHQMNTKFVNNLPPYWAKYVTNVKNNKDISATTYVELYTYLKLYEPHAMKTLKKQERSSSIVDPMAYLASTTHHLTPTQPTNLPPSTSSLTLPPQPAGQSSNDAMLATMNQIVNLLSGFQKQFLPTNNQLKTSSNSRSHATVHDGQIVTETVQRKALGNVGNTGTKGTQSYGQVTDNKGKLPLAIRTTNIFEVSHEDAYNSDVDEGPHAAVAFMANLSSTSETNGATTSHVNEVHTNDNQIFDSVNHLLADEMHQEEHLDSDVESNIDDNTIPYHQYQLDSEVQDVPTEAKISQPTLYDGHALLKPTNTPVRVHDNKEPLVQAEVSRTKMSNRPGTIKPINYVELNALYSHFVPQKELSREQVYWLPAEELATQKSYPPKPVTMFVHTRLAPSKAFTEQVISFYEHVKELVQSLDENLVKEVTEFMRTFDELDKEDRPLGEELRSNYVRENSKVIELEAKILKQQQMFAESDKRCSFIQKNHIDLQIKFRNYKECLKNQTIGDNSHSPIVNSVFKINQLKKQLQGKDGTIRKLQTQINSMIRIQNDGFKVENVNLKRRYQELSRSNSHSRDTLTRKLTALTVENAKLKSESLSKMHSELIVPEKPKVLALGMYAISSKYIVPPRRVNRAEPTPLPKKKQATFQEPPSRPSNRPTQKTVVQQNKKPNIHVNLSTRVQPATGASKPMSKSDTRNHSTLPAKREKARRVEDHHRNLNKQNHVDSRLNVKRIGFVSNSNIICNACNESLVFATHDNCVVRNLKSVNVKTPTTKHNVKTTKNVWKAKVVTVRSQWKPTGRHFTLYDEYPLTRIVEPIVEPLELTSCVSSNSKVTMISSMVSYKDDLYKLLLVQVMATPAILVSAEENLGDHIDIRMDIIYPEPVAAVAFPAPAVELTALRFRVDIAEAENASLRARIKTTEAIEKITHKRERHARVEIEQQLAAV
nr:hypothetical protein [Tanacetum cinerariifolium]